MLRVLNDTAYTIIENARQARRLPGWLATCALGVAMIVLSSLLGSIPYLAWLALNTVPGWSAFPLTTSLNQAALLIFSFLPVFLLLYLWIHLYEIRPFSSLGLSRHAWLRKYCFGFFAGIIMFSAVFAVLAAAGLVKEDLGSGNQPAAASIPPVLIVLAGWIVQGPGEEILCRGWMMPVLSARYRVSAGVLLSSLVFAIYHSLNPSFSTVAFLNIFLVGIFLSLFTLAEGSIWGVFGWHTAWNWAQGNIFGLPVSGLGSGGGSILHFQVHGPALLTGSGFGPEGGMAVTGILVGGIALALWFLLRKTSQNPR